MKKPKDEKSKKFNLKTEKIFSKIFDDLQAAMAQTKIDDSAAADIILWASTQFIAAIMDAHVKMSGKVLNQVFADVIFDLGSHLGIEVTPENQTVEANKDDPVH